MSWLGTLRIEYSRQGAATRGHDRHDGPLRVLKAFYPEGDAICHHTLVHPPGGVAGGDELDVHLHLAADTHAVLTTPSATRFYRTRGPMAHQRVEAHLAPGARLEWLPLENIVHDGALVRNAQTFHLDPGAEMLGWDVLALGLPASGEPWSHGRFEQRLYLPGLWLEQGRIDANDTLLLDSPLGWTGHRVLATLWLANGSALSGAHQHELLETARSAITDHPGCVAGVTAPNAQVVVVRALAPRVEPLMALLTTVRQRWRHTAWALPECNPRVWST